MTVYVRPAALAMKMRFDKMAVYARHAALAMKMFPRREARHSLTYNYCGMVLRQHAAEENTI